MGGTRRTEANPGVVKLALRRPGCAASLGTVRAVGGKGRASVRRGPPPTRPLGPIAYPRSARAARGSEAGMSGQAHTPRPQSRPRLVAAGGLTVVVHQA